MANYTINQMQGDSKDRVAHDFYPTPDHATIKILEREEFIGNVWEPACGNGAISKLVESKLKLPVFSTDLHDRGYGQTGVDFLFCQPPAERIDNIITNPPFGLATEFIQRSLLLSERKVAMLLKLNALAGSNRYKQIYSKTPPSRIYVFCNRLNFDRGDEKAKKSGGVLEYAWFVWQRDWQANTEVDWLI